MHELSIAQNIVDIVRQYVPSDKGEKVKAVRLRVGELSGVVADSLQFCFSIIIADTPLRGSTLEIERVPFRLHCAKCRTTFANEFGVVTCPSCNSSETEIVSGTEMQIESLELAEDGGG